MATLAIDLGRSAREEEEDKGLPYRYRASGPPAGSDKATASVLANGRGAEEK